MTLKLGSTDVSKVYLGTTAVQKVYLGSTLVWSSFTPAGMNKTGTQTMAASNGYTKVTGWLADTANFPGSTVSTDGLVVPTSGSTKISASVAGQAGLSGTATIQILVNGTVVATGAAATYTDTSFGVYSGTSTATYTGTLTAGDIVTVQYKYSIYTGITINVSPTFVQLLAP